MKWTPPHAEITPISFFIHKQVNFYWNNKQNLPHLLTNFKLVLLFSQTNRKKNLNSHSPNRYITKTQEQAEDNNKNSKTNTPFSPKNKQRIILTIPLQPSNRAHNSKKEQKIMQH